MSKFGYSFSERQKAGLATGVFGLCCNLALATAKIVAGLASNSIAIYNDGINNLLDSGSAVTVIFSFFASSKRRDKTHPHGHGRSEYIGGFVISFLILSTAVTLGRQSIERIINPEEVEITPVVLAVLAGSVAVKIGMALTYRWRNRKIKSTILAASSRDSISDAFTTTTIIAAVLLAPISDLPIDGLAGLLVVGFIGYQGLVSFWENCTYLLGKSTDAKTLRGMRKVVCGAGSFERVLSIDFHDYGPEQHSAIIKAELRKGVKKAELERDIAEIKRRLKGEFGVEGVIYWPPEV